MKYCRDKKDVPKTAHYAIIVFSSFYVPGDARSQSAPGHGYPAHTEQTSEYIVFENKSEWEAEVSKRAGKVFQQENFVAMFVQPAKTSLDIRVEVDDFELPPRPKHP